MDLNRLSPGLATSLRTSVGLLLPKGFTLPRRQTLHISNNVQSTFTVGQGWLHDGPNNCGVCRRLRYNSLRWIRHGLSQRYGQLQQIFRYQYYPKGC